MLPHYKTIVISDVPLGTDRRNLKKLIYFLKNNTCDRLILSGDVMKGWQITTIKKIYKRQALFLNALFKLIEKHGTEIIFITGQDEMRKSKKHIVKFGNFSFHKEYLLTSGTFKYKVTNGDKLSGSIMAKLFPRFRIMPYLIYLFINRKYNEYRFRKGFSYRSILKNSIYRKSENLFVNNVRKDIIKISLDDHCDGIICGTNHKPCIQQFGLVTYLNSGFWSESNMGLVESNTGNWSLLSYAETIDAERKARKFYRMQKRLMDNSEEEISGPLKAKTA